MSHSRSTYRDRSRDEGPPSAPYPEEEGAAPAATAPRQTIQERVADACSAHLAGMALPPLPMPAPGVEIIAGRLSALLADVEWLEKRGKNDHHKFRHITIDDLRDMVGKLLNEHGLAFSQSLIDMRCIGSALFGVYDFALYAADAPGVALWGRAGASVLLVSGKGTVDDKAASKVHAAAFKDWAKGVLCIPQGDDPDPVRVGNDEPDSAEGDRRAPMASGGRGAGAAVRGQHADDRPPVEEGGKRTHDDAGLPIFPRFDRAQDYHAAMVKVIGELGDDGAKIDALFAREEASLARLKNGFSKLHGEIIDAADKARGA